MFEKPALVVVSEFFLLSKSSSSLRVTITVKNCAQFLIHSCRLYQQTAPSVTPLFSPTRRMTWYLSSPCGSHQLSLLVSFFLPHLLLFNLQFIYFPVFFTLSFIIDSTTLWQEFEVSFKLCSALLNPNWSLHVPKIPFILYLNIFLVSWRLCRMDQLVRQQCNSCYKL